MLKKIIFTAVHLIFWIVYISLSLETSFKVSQGWDMFLSLYQVYIILLVWVAVAVYSSYFIFSGWLLTQKKPIKYLLISTGGTPALSGFFFLVIYYLTPSSRELLHTKLYLSSTVATFIFIQIGTLMRAFVNWYNEQEKVQEREKLNLQNELAMLKSQVNPHFLFNTLNNIDSLIQYNPKKASEAIIMLSDLMRYLLYETNQDTILLQQEKECLDKLVELHRLRHKDENTISYSTRLKDKKRQIAPLLLLPFVENAFKFASAKKGHPLVDIELIDSDEELRFTCQNYFIPAEGDNREQGGLGLANVKKRLHAYYPGKHTLHIDKNIELYTVNLIIKHDH